MSAARRRTAGARSAIRGSCHCGNVRFTLSWPDAGREIAARRCGCTFCVKHGAVWTSKPGGRLEARVADPAAIARYEFGTATAGFTVCKRCGAVPFVTSAIDGTTYAVVNVNTFDAAESFAIRVADTSFDGEEVADRLARRRRNWIGDVRIMEGGS